MGWESLPEDILLRIYAQLGIEVLLVGAPLACRAWYSPSMDPCLYKNLNLYRWLTVARRLTGGDRNKNSVVDPGDVLRVAVTRGGGAVERVGFPYLATDDDLVFVADRCPHLKFFYIRSLMKISRTAFVYAIRKWKDLEGMAIDGHSIERKLLDEFCSSGKRIVPFKIGTHLCFFQLGS